ncbi:TadE/TadG family type IV pilus assembly protein [Roseomonas sp. HF4]|uniref:TadE/TadG family type IV pilus assembly protein n=1 Tax=Roseomonas sp. HF4 TaxID=2562313 RepID=UPI0010C01966|nr:TadE/TadG family type IV pilus assembly protein [Roseomonas sp. HF4]
MLNFVGAKKKLRYARSRRGASAVEFALVGAVFFIGLLGAIEVGRYFAVTQGLRNFIGDSLRFGIVNMTDGQRLCGANLVTAVDRGGVVGGLISQSPNTCVTRRRIVNPNNEFDVLFEVEVVTDVVFNFTISSFGFTQQRFSNTSVLGFRL